MQINTLSKFGSVRVSVCGHPAELMQHIATNLGIAVDSTILQEDAPFDKVLPSDKVLMIDAPTYWDEAAIVTVLDALQEHPTRFFQMVTAEGRRLPAYALMGTYAHEFQIKKARALTISSVRSISTVVEFHAFREFIRTTIIARHIEAGVVMLAPESVTIDQHVTLGAGCVLEAGVVLRGHTVVGEGCRIGPFTLIDNCQIGHHCTINASQLYHSTVASHVSLGPYAYVRPGCHIEKEAHIGSFVELKNSQIGESSNVAHLSYVGDAQVGAHVNLGCGTVTANFNGVSKHKTVIDDHAFVGCNVALVAPVTVGEGAVIGAGSTITQDVPPYALAVARERQSVKADWARDRDRNW